MLEGDEPRGGHSKWYHVLMNGERVGDMTNGTWSYKLERTIGFGLVSADCQIGDSVEVIKDGETISGRLTGIPFKTEDAKA